jgi:uncharacterized membrane protein
MASYHPQIVHFVIALLGLGVVLRVLSLLRRPAWIGPTATLLLLLGATASVLAVWSGDAAHGPVERVPGARQAVEEHEEWGVRTRNVFLGVAVLELIALAVRPRRRGWVLAAAAVLGGVGLWCLYEAGEHGGELVYAYAGGVGIRSGDPRDVERLFVAGVYHQAQQDRRAGRAADAAAIIEEAARRFPDDPEVQVLAGESLLVDRNDATAALASLDRVGVPDGNRALRLRHGMLRAEALAKAGQHDAALAVVQALADAFPDSVRLKEQLTRLARARDGATSRP